MRRLFVLYHCEYRAFCFVTACTFRVAQLLCCCCGFHRGCGVALFAGTACSPSSITCAQHPNKSRGYSVVLTVWALVQIFPVPSIILSLSCLTTLLQLHRFIYWMIWEEFNLLVDRDFEGGFYLLFSIRLELLRKPKKSAVVWTMLAVQVVMSIRIFTHITWFCPGPPSYVRRVAGCW
jgi:hypothetical protein